MSTGERAEEASHKWCVLGARHQFSRFRILEMQILHTIAFQNYALKFKQKLPSSIINNNNDDSSARHFSKKYLAEGKSN